MTQNHSSRAQKPSPQKNKGPRIHLRHAMLVFFLLGACLANIYAFRLNHYVRLPDIPFEKIEIGLAIADFDMPNLDMPQIEMPTVKLPDFQMPEIEWPDISVPDISLPDIKWPEWKTPDLIKNWTWPPVPLPQMPEIKAPDLSPLTNAAGHQWSKLTRLFETSERVETLPRNIALEFAHIEPAAGTQGNDVAYAETNDEEENQSAFRYEIEEPSITVETVLVPRRSTVISSSRDGRIDEIFFDNGEEFRKGEILVAYDCRDIEAEYAALNFKEELSEKKVMRSAKLFKLEIISEIESLNLEAEQKKAEADKRVIQQRLDSCYIRAAFDGRVTSRLANPGEYTRTDRVLMEVASRETLEAEFLLPSRWLRWVNKNAPIAVNIVETGQKYEAVITQIHGEVDPISQSIQMSASLAPYNDPLLPGMSGEALIDVNAIREAGIAGYLEPAGE